MKYNNIQQLLKINHCSLLNLNSTTSTMDEAKKKIKELNSNFVIIANQQTQGRGRRGNSWISPPGNIYLSLVLKNDFPIEQHYLYSIITLLSIKKTINNYGCDEILFKWPNDIFFQDKKFGGVLIENINQNNQNNYIIIGLGLNLSSSPNLKNYNTTFIKKFINLGNEIEFLEFFFINFFKHLNNYYNTKNLLFTEFKKSLMFLNKKVNIQIDNNKSITGIFKDIDNEGGLILNKDNKITHIYSGNILI